MKIYFQLLAFTISLLTLVSCGSNNMETKVDKIFSEFDDSTPGAAVGVFKDSKLVFAKGYGLADLESKTPIDSKTNFRLASVTKQFTATCILLLEKEGKLSLDDKLTDIFPSFPEYGKNISIKQVLQHTSGMLAYEDFVDTVQVMDKDVLQIMMDQDSTYFEPGTQHRYSNSGYAVLAMIVEETFRENISRISRRKNLQTCRYDKLRSFCKRS